MSGKLKFVSRMRTLAGLLLLAELLSVGWVAAFYFLYASQAVGSLSVSWLLFIGMIMPFNWPGAVVCGLLSMLLSVDAVIILTAGMLIVIALIINRAVWSPNPRSYDFLVKCMRLEIVKSIILMLLGCFIALIDIKGQEDVLYMAVAVYEAGSACSILFFYRLLSAVDGMDYREIFQTDGKRPYGQ